MEVQRHVYQTSHGGRIFCPLEHEARIVRAKQHFPAAHYVGMAHGAASNGRFLGQHTERQLIDFLHTIEYADKIAQALYPHHHAEGKRAH